MALARKDISTAWTRDNRNAINDNFKELYDAPDRIEGLADEAVLRSNEAIDTANVAKTTANSAETKAESVQEQFNQVVIEGDSSVEAAQARVTADGKTFTTLQERLNSSDSQLAERVTKEVVPSGNLVDKLNNLIRVRGMYARVHDNELKIGIGMSDQLRSVVEYCFRHNGDGLLLLRGVKSGVEDRTLNRLPPVNLSSEFNTNTPGQEYTTTIGASFNFEFTGTSMSFRRRMESRGGVWELILDNGMRRFVSCYYPDSPSIQGDDIVFEDLPYSTYKGIAIFRGDDLVNPPSSSPSRGYLDNTLGPISTGVIKPIDDTAAKNIISPSSIPDFAISAKPSGASYGRVWVPQHSNIKDVSKNVFVKIIIDGRIVSETSGELPDIEFIDINDFELLQKFEAHNPNGSDGAMWEHFVSHSIRARSPYLALQNSLKVLKDVEVGSLYFGMLPAERPNTSRLLLNNGEEFKPVPNDGTELGFGLDVSSALFTGTYTPGNFHGCAIDVSSLKEAVSYDKEVQPNTPGRITFREDGVAKVYFTTINTNTIKAGEQYSCENRICCISGVRFPNDDIASVG